MHKQPADVQEPKPPLFRQVKSLPRFTWFTWFYLKKA
jgi:hypothetical protein